MHYNIQGLTAVVLMGQHDNTIVLWFEKDRQPLILYKRHSLIFNFLNDSLLSSQAPKYI